MSLSIDNLDSRIICLLQEEGCMPYTQIAKELNISESTVRTRIWRLIRGKIISIVAVCNPRKTGFLLTGNIKLRVQSSKQKEVIWELRDFWEIIYIALMTGSSDIDIDFVVTSLDDLHILINEKMSSIEGIENIETSIITSYEKKVFNYGTGLSHGIDSLHTID